MKLYQLYLFDKPAEYIAAENEREAVMKALYSHARDDNDRWVRCTQIFLPLAYANYVTAKEIKEAEPYE